jgi:pectin methylesterase-like acyl-CoA thioesterase
MSKNSKVNPGHNGTGKGKGHVEHGNGNGYGHDKHHAPAPPPAPNFADGVVTLVSAGGTSTFASITEALAAAVAGDTLQVGAGVYKEVFTLNADVTIIGEKGAVIDGSASRSRRACRAPSNWATAPTAPPCPA